MRFDLVYGNEAEERHCGSLVAETCADVMSVLMRVSEGGASAVLHGGVLEQGRGTHVSRLREACTKME